DDTANFFAIYDLGDAPALYRSVAKIRASPMSWRDEKAKYSPLAALAPLKSIFEAARQASLAPRLGQPASVAPETRP
ncbi:hypothetical protein, partial [Campylobacter rectus]|uniref:hypothetical protein n=1 Tax=Campylobacter rectus TaxID=203 RepID=UPI0023F4E9EB